MWFLPKDNAYGAWPSSGEIDLVLSRGNRNFTNAEGKHLGVEQFESSIHFGPFAGLDQTSQFIRNSKPGNGFNNEFHRFQMEWTPGNNFYYNQIASRMHECFKNEIRIKFLFFRKIKLCLALMTLKLVQ